MTKHKKLVPHMDAIDLEAEREGQSIKKASEVRVKRTNKKPKVGPVDSRTLDDSFFEHYGYSGYTVKRGEDD